MRVDWSPQALPYLRDKAADILIKAAEAWMGADSITESEREVGAANISELANLLTVTDLTWIDSDASQMLADTMDSVPEWSPAATMPTARGLVAFERPPAAVVWTGGIDGARREVAVDAIVWGPADGGLVKVRILSRLTGHREYLSPLRDGTPLHEVLAVSMPVDATIGGGLEVRTVKVKGFSGRAADSGAMQSLVGALWLLMSQPQVLAEDVPVNARVRRKATATRPKQVLEVRVSVRTPRRVGRSAGSARRGKAVSRWWVRGHWRQQAWGRGRRLRKPIFIAPHLAGNPDAEVDSRPNVQVIRDFSDRK
jgi:hypothetical protein